MALSLPKIEKEIHALSAQGKTALLRALIADLDDEVDENVAEPGIGFEIPIEAVLK